MHIVHLPDPLKQAEGQKTFAGAVGLIFDTKASTAKLSLAEEGIIDTFFDTLDWASSDPTVNLVSFGNLMANVDMGNRWTYMGSLTTPNCKSTIDWNVLSTVYPIKQAHLDLFKKQLDKATGYTSEAPLSKIGNYRDIQSIDDHNVHYIKTEKISNSDTGLTIGIIILAVFVIVLIITVCIYVAKLNALLKND